MSRKNPMNPLAQPRFYCIQKSSGVIGIDEFSERIARGSGLTPGDVEGVLSDLIDEIVDQVMDGRSVDLGPLGSMRLTFRCDGCDDEEELDVHKIKRIRIVFKPSKALNDSLLDIPFKKYQMW